MAEVLPQLVLVAVLVLVNAAFAGCEMALVALREGQLQRLESESRSGEVLARLARDPNRFLATIQVGITLAGFLASAAAAVSLAEPLQDPLSFLGGAAEPVSIVVVTLVLAYLTLVFGELTPKRLAMQRAERWGMLAARPLAGMATVTRPVVWLLSRSTDLAVRLLGGDPDARREEVTEEELREMVVNQESVSAQQRSIIAGAFDAADRPLQHVLVPRGDVLVLDGATTCAEGLARLVEAGHSRAPVADGADLDRVVGVVHLRDLVGDADRTVAEVATEIPLFPETAHVLDVLRQLQVGRSHLAVVVDEHGGADGIVTVEDLIEELVGEIYDEADRDVAAVERTDEDTFVVSGRFPVHDLATLGIDAPEGPYATVAGLVLDRLRRIPEEPGDVVAVGDWDVEVLAVEKHSISRVRLTRLPATPGPSDQDG